MEIQELIKKIGLSNIKIYLKDNQLNLQIPKGIEVPELLDEIRDNRQNVISFLNRSVNHKIDLKSDVFIGKDNTYPVDYKQEMELLMFKLGIRQHFNNHIVLDLNGVDKKKMENSLKILAHRHEALRTIFFLQNHMVLQKICEVDKFAPFLEYEDLRDSRREKDEVIKQLSTYNFNFEIEPSFKCKLLRINNDDFLFVLVVDHMIRDPETMGILVNDLGIIYNYPNDYEEKLIPLQWGVKDYINYFYSKYLENYEKDRSYFKELFDNRPGRLLLKSNCNPSKATKALSYGDIIVNDLNRIEISEELKDFNFYGKIQSARYFRGQYHIFKINHELKLGCESLILDFKTTYYRFFLACFGILISTISSNKEIVIDTPISLRDREEFTGVVGWFLSTLLLKINVYEHSTFKELCEYCDSIFFEAYKHKFAYSNKILEWVNVPVNELVHGFLDIHDLDSGKGIRMPENFKESFSDSNRFYSSISLLIFVYENGLQITLGTQSDEPINNILIQYKNIFVDIISTVIKKPDISIKELLLSLND